MSRLRTIAAMLLLGGVIAAGRAAWGPPPALVVEVPADAGDGAVRAAVREALLLEEARRLGWAETDPVVARILVDGLRGAGEPGDDAALLERARALGLDRTDPLVRARLLDRARRALSEGLVPSDAQLAAWLAAHPARFAGPARVTVRIGPPGALGAPQVLTPPRLATLHGEAVADAVAAASIGQEVGPVATVRGPVVARVEAREEGRVPSLEEVRGRVLEDWRRAQDAGPLVDALAARWRVEVVRR